MPLQNSDMFCAEHIFVPPTLPNILRQYAKAAIRTQPYDLLRWSVSYFRALANGESPPVKERLENLPPNHKSGLSPGFLKVLHKQFGKKSVVCVADLYEIWFGLSLDDASLRNMLQLSGCKDQNVVHWLTFLGVAAGHLNDNLLQTMHLLCELITHEPEGGSASIPMEIFKQLYLTLAEMNCPDIPGIGERVPDSTTSAAISYLTELADRNMGFILPRNTTHFLCPPLY